MRAKRGSIILHELESREDQLADLITFQSRADDKTAEEYALEGGATLHLVLALRGGAN